MAITKCPLYDDAYYTYSLSLDNEVFTFDFLWTERAGLWALTLRDSDDSVVFENVYLMPATRLLAQYNFTKPVGDFILMPYNTNDIFKDFTDLRDMSENYFLIYDSEL